jgi:Zn-dependent protease
MAAGSTGFMLNLLQLVPAKPLDGGFIIQAVSRWLLIPGTALLLCLAYFFQSVLLLIIGVISAFALVKQFYPARKAEHGESPETSSDTGQAADPGIPAAVPGSALPAEARAYVASPLLSAGPKKGITLSTELKAASLPQRVIIAIAYLGLAAMLGYLYWLSSSEVVSIMPHKH